MTTTPQDRRSKRKKKAEPVFSFEAEGETFTFIKPTSDVVTPGWVRKHRTMTDVDQFFTLLEELADEDTLDVLDNLPQKEFERINEEFFEHLGADRGE